MVPAPHWVLACYVESLTLPIKIEFLRQSNPVLSLTSASIVVVSLMASNNRARITCSELYLGNFIKKKQVCAVGNNASTAPKEPVKRSLNFVGRYLGRRHRAHTNCKNNAASHGSNVRSTRQNLSTVMSCSETFVSSTVCSCKR